MWVGLKTINFPTQWHRLYFVYSCECLCSQANADNKVIKYIDTLATKKKSYYAFHSYLCVVNISMDYIHNISAKTFIVR